MRFNFPPLIPRLNECTSLCAPNGEGAKLRGQGPRAEADAARRLPACESRDAGGVPPRKLR